MKCKNGSIFQIFLRIFLSVLFAHNRCKHQVCTNIYVRQGVIKKNHNLKTIQDILIILASKCTGRLTVFLRFFRIFPRTVRNAQNVMKCHYLEFSYNNFQAILKRLFRYRAMSKSNNYCNEKKQCLCSQCMCMFLHFDVVFRLQYKTASVYLSQSFI